MKNGPRQVVRLRKEIHRPSHGCGNEYRERSQANQGARAVGRAQEGEHLDIDNGPQQQEGEDRARRNVSANGRIKNESTLAQIEMTNARSIIARTDNSGSLPSATRVSRCTRT